MKKALLSTTLLLIALPASAQSPYAGEETRSIKALGEKEQQALLAGKGMGLARPAELNGYPGPAHVLEHAEALALSSEQQEQTEALFQRVKKEARTLGRERVEAEAALDALFASREITRESLAEHLDHIGTLKTRLRRAHLQAHLEQARILDKQQFASTNGFADIRTTAARGTTMVSVTAPPWAQRPLLPLNVGTDRYKTAIRIEPHNSHNRLCELCRGSL